MPSASGLARKAYDALPTSVTRAVRLVPFGWRVGRAYRRTLALLLETDRWDAARLEALATERLGGLLDGALRDVPYYRDRYGHLRGRDPWRVLRDIEPIRKSDMQADPELFLDRTRPRRSTYETSTGGTTGEPLRIVLDREGFQLEWAFMVAQWMRAGFRPGMPRATFRGVPFRDGRLWQDNPVYDELKFSPFAMSDRSLAAYVEELRRYRPRFLYGYPSALTTLAHWVERHPDAGMPPVQGMLCGSENVRPGQRELLERVFGARFFSWYGMSEKVILAGECERSSRYHAFPQYGITEVLDAHGNLTSEPGSDGELVGTGFINRAMPFIRYRTGDFATLEADRCEACGRHFPLLGPVRGRWVQEMVVARSGAHVSLTALNMHGEVFSGIERFQFHQREVGRVTLRLVPASGTLDERARSRILSALHGKTGDEIAWTLESVATIEPTPRGKGVFLVQELDDEQG